MQVVFDMETRDPDDVLTLCLIASHPAISLAAVTVNPGTPHQIAVVRAVLDRLECAVPIGARHATSTAAAVSPFHDAWLGALPAAPAAADAVPVLVAALAQGATLLTGAPLQSVRRLLRERPEVRIARWVAQGGFAGDNLVALGERLAKFDGRETCESHNFGVDAKAAMTALTSDRIARRELVGKNVTHGVTWDAALQERVARADGLSAGARLALEAMTVYLAERPEGKYLHDPLALAAVVDPGAFRWIEVEVFAERGAWGARATAGTGTFIAIGVDRERAIAAMFAPARVAAA